MSSPAPSPAPINFPPLIFALDGSLTVQYLTYPSGVFVFVPPHSFTLTNVPPTGPTG